MGGKAEGAEDPLVAAKNVIFTLIVLAALLWMADLLLGVDTSAPTGRQYQCTASDGSTSIVTDANDCNGVTRPITPDDNPDAPSDLLGGIKEAETLAAQAVGSILFILKIIVTVAAIAVIGVLRVRTY